jgi:rfaE bifunctional protein nucleotidyltransferase chain/domain
MNVPQSPKVLTLPEMVERSRGFSEKCRLVFTNGCFDLLHPGHVDYLIRARALGEALVVGLNSDDSVRRLGKGADRPVNGQDARAYVLAGLQSVDFVVVFEEDTPYEIISAIRPQVLVKGGDWPVEKIVGRDVVEGFGGTVLSLPLLEGFSTTETIRRIRNSRH